MMGKVRERARILRSRPLGLNDEYSGMLKEGHERARVRCREKDRWVRVSLAIFPFEASSISSISWAFPDPEASAETRGE